MGVIWSIFGKGIDIYGEYLESGWTFFSHVFFFLAIIMMGVFALYSVPMLDTMTADPSSFNVLHIALIEAGAHIHTTWIAGNWMAWLIGPILGYIAGGILGVTVLHWFFIHVVSSVREVVLGR